jgi:uncharacterized membrane protein
MQFSTRILRQLVRDRVSQVTLGVFVGTFLYCLLLLRVVQSAPTPRVPTLGVAGAVVLALVAMGQLVYFIHHIVQIIQANHLVAGIADEAEEVVRSVFTAIEEPEAPLPADWEELPRHPIRATSSGYVQLVSVEALAAVARAARGVIVVKTPMGHFATAGIPLAELRAPSPPSDEAEAEVASAFDVGVIRTMQDDVEWGIRLIVDIALKAISPAVNDPSTAAMCVDHLGRLLVLAAGRHAPPGARGAGEDGVARVVVPRPSLAGLIDLSFQQIRQFSRADMAVSIRILRALGRVLAVTEDAEARARIRLHARLVVSAVSPAFADEDCDALWELAVELGVPRAAKPA